MKVSDCGLTLSILYHKVEEEAEVRGCFMKTRDVLVLLGALVLHTIGLPLMFLACMSDLFEDMGKEVSFYKPL